MKNDVIDIDVSRKHFRLVGTGHVFRSSAREVKKQVEDFEPDIIAIELDPRRLQALLHPPKYSTSQLLKQPKKHRLIIHFLFQALQKKIGKSLKTRPGIEFLAALKEARKRKIPVALIDRDLQITLNRAFKKLPLGEKIAILKGLVGGLVGIGQKQDLLKVMDQKEELLQEFRHELPTLYKILVTERDKHMTQVLLSLPYKRILVVVGAGHIPGMTKELQKYRK